MISILNRLQMSKNDMNKQSNHTVHRIRNDIIFIIALLVLSAAALVYLFVFRSGGNTVEVTVDGELFGVYRLSEDILVEIQSGGGGTNRLVISGGKAHMESASCPDGICVAHRPVFRDSESIVCLPNRVVVTVKTENDTDSPDITA